MTTADWIKARRELLNAATKGPWEADGSEITQHWSLPGPWKTVASSEVVCGSYCYGGVGRGIEHATDAALIADARTSLPLALDALEAVLAVVRPHRREPATDGSVDEHDYVGALADEIETAIDTALRGES